MKWWAQSFLVGVPKITCGFRNDDGVVKVLQTFKTAEIPHETQVVYSIPEYAPTHTNFMLEMRGVVMTPPTLYSYTNILYSCFSFTCTLLTSTNFTLFTFPQVDLTMWQPSVCLNFLDELLTWIRKTVIKDDPK